jgi:hypothetical protein
MPVCNAAGCPRPAWPAAPAATDRARGARWARSLLAHVGAKQRAAVAAMIRTIFTQETKAEALAQWDKVADALRDKHDKLGALMDAAREDVLTYMDYPKEHGAQIASTDELDKGFVRGSRSGGRGPERPPRVWRRHAPTWSRRWSTTWRAVPSRPKPARRSGPAGAMLSRHGRPRGEQRGRGWKPRRAA